MSIKLNKQRVLDVLRKQQSSISLLDLLAQLGAGYPERTVRRWLNEWQKVGLVERYGLKRGTRYIAVHDNLNPESDLSYFSPASEKIIEKVKRPFTLRNPVTYNPAWLKSYRPNIDCYLQPSQEDRLYEAGKRARNHEPAGTYARQIYQRLLIDLSFNSSRLEGNTYSLLETKRLLIDGIDAPGKLNEEKTMIMNHKEAIRYLVDTPGEIHIQTSTICTLHYLLSDGLVAPQYAGKVRDYGVRIGGSCYIPLENPELLQAHLHEICRKAAEIKKPYEQSLFLLAHIAYLQAFVDVNKRTSRLSANIPLINNNLVPLSFNDISQQDYTTAMIAVYELNDIRPLIDLYLHSYLRTALIYDATIEAIGFDPVRVQYRQQRREMIRYIIVNQLSGQQMQAYITAEIQKLIAPEAQAQVINNIQEDLAQLGPHSITGFGITGEQLKAWLAKRS